MSSFVEKGISSGDPYLLIHGIDRGLLPEFQAMTSYFEMGALSIPQIIAHLKKKPPAISILRKYWSYLTTYAPPVSPHFQALYDEVKRLNLSEPSLDVQSPAAIRTAVQGVFYAGVEAIAKGLLEREPISEIDAKKIFMKVMEEYKPKEVTVRCLDSGPDLPRRVVLDPLHRCFFILSEENGRSIHVSDRKVIWQATCWSFLKNGVGFIRSEYVDIRFCGNNDQQRKQHSDVTRWVNRDTMVEVRLPLRAGKATFALLEEAYDSDLATYLNTESLSIDEIEQILKVVSEALSRMHAVGILHWNISTSTILVKRSQISLLKVKVTNFAHSFRFWDDPSYKPASYHAKEHSGPEFFDQTLHTVDPFVQRKASECYAVGSLLFELLQGFHKVQLCPEWLRAKIAETEVETTKRLYQICLGLIERRPELRLTMNDVNNRLTSSERRLGVLI